MKIGFNQGKKGLLYTFVFRLLVLILQSAVHGHASSEQDTDFRPHFQTTHSIRNASRHMSFLHRVTSNISRQTPFSTSHSNEPPNNDVVALVLYAVLSVLGTTVNIFEISSLIIQENLRHHSNAFLANQALANLLVTTIGFPASCIAILSGNHRYPFVCYWQWYSALLCFFTSIINFFFIAVENLLKARKKKQTNSISSGGVYTVCCGVKMVVGIIFFTWIASVNWILVLIFMDNSHDVCNREYGYSVIFLSFLVPLSLTMFTFAFAIHSYKRHLNELELRQCLESREDNLHRQLFKSNALAYLMFLCFWMPFAIAVSISASESSTSSARIQPTSSSFQLQQGVTFQSAVRTTRTNYVAATPNTVETLLIIAQTYSCFCGLVYAFTNGSFGQAFVHLTRYFCCKAHPEFTKSTFQEKPRGTVRVHIGMETRVGERSARTTKLMAAMIHDSPHRGGGRSGDHYL